VTKEDIIELKRERQKLLEERTQLKTKIARLECRANARPERRTGIRRY
jgi:hypothetical protein